MAVKNADVLHSRAAGGQGNQKQSAVWRAGVHSRPAAKQPIT